MGENFVSGAFLNPTSVFFVSGVTVSIISFDKTSGKHSVSVSAINLVLWETVPCRFLALSHHNCLFTQKLIVIRLSIVKGDGPGCCYKRPHTNKLLNYRSTYVGYFE